MMYPGANLSGQFIQITKRKHVSPLIPSGVWQGFELSATRTFAASPIMELNGISFAFGSFHSELFSTEDKNSESSPYFAAPLCEISSWRWPFFCRSLQNLHSRISCVFKLLFKLLNTSEKHLNYLRPTNHVSTLNIYGHDSKDFTFTLFCLFCLESICP